MAEPTDPGLFDQSERFDQAYREVELSYSEGRFQEALQQADVLLEQHSPGEGDPRTERLKLILGHIHLHGLQQPERAIGHYQNVLDTGSTPTYRDLAEQGLSLCQDAIARSATILPAGMTDSARAGIASPAMPWLLESGSGPSGQDLDFSIEPVRVEELIFTAPAASKGPAMAQPSQTKASLAVDPLAEAELARGLLRVVLS
ncbi:hypothetical protein KQ313_05440 [Synechococcus sp. CS-1325]|uniref:hypothetical protein n=1 Tax=unclassified Synechococcus TaxID=2626047 RepID=UPI000DAFDC93|nr:MULTISPECIES: hypothetical protein [unclassified Synechococcus]MCT0199117.1 hypothetical protein [Synechococcus sp. CS-1325]MCT0231106.1 hypothetical protein [Synechococcus sp. CS-1324]PZV01926.1 MAG: hypothetical protein DCF24_03095 [Cyanobium sp.]PZV04400.1 MAG: hypothetical protein DCF23_06260 [Cyanobium sp.]